MVVGEEHRIHVQEVIPMKSKVYRTVAVNRVNLDDLFQGRSPALVHVGCDIGKDHIVAVLRWGLGDFARPWRIANTADVRRAAALLAEVARRCRVLVAMEPTGTYGDAWRQALQGVGLEAQRVSPKQASDYAEVFDGVPSQHDGKDAAVVAELAAQGKCWPWPLVPPSELEQELGYHVDWMDGQRRQMMQWYGRVEALVSRHWPEATRVVPLSSGTLLQCLVTYGGPQGLAAAPDGLARVCAWGRQRLGSDQAEALVASAAATLGVAMGPWDEERLRRFAREIQGCRREIAASSRRLQALGSQQAVIAAMGAVVGVPTACVLWAELGDPRGYHCGGAYRKAMGLNLAERSSGRWQGKLRISKRGSSKARRWLYLAALRWVRTEPVRGWYQRQVAARRGERKPALIGVMRKLALALYQVGGRGQVFDPEVLYRKLLATPCGGGK
jgi:transposase